MTTARINRRRFAAVTAAFGFGAAAAPMAAQNATPEASPAASPVASNEATITNLITADIEQLPEAPFTVRLLRIDLEPGTVNPFHSHHGPEISVVESGKITVASQGTAFVTRADGTDEDLTDAETVLAAGDTIHYPAEVAMYYENASEEKATMLNAVVIPVGPDYANERITYLDGKPDLTGLSYQKLGDGLVQNMDQQAATWTVDAIDLPASVDLPAISGVGMITPTSGNLSFRIDAGQVQVTRSDSNMLQPNAVLGTGFSLADGDAAFFPNGMSATPRTDETGTLSMLSMNIDPANGVPDEAATLTFTEGDGTVAVGRPQDATGRTVTTNSGDVNMRAEPNVNADVVDQIAEGVELEVISGPEEADDYTWYEVKVPGDGGSQGWMVSEFLDGLDAAPEVTPEPATDDDDGTAGEATTAASGETVVTIESDVYLRADASVANEPVTSLAEGTVLTVTGDPVEGDDYTWLPVETEDGLTGFVVIDFVEPAPAGE